MTTPGPHPWQPHARQAPPPPPGRPAEEYAVRTPPPARSAPAPEPWHVDPALRPRPPRAATGEPRGLREAGTTAAHPHLTPRPGPEAARHALSPLAPAAEWLRDYPDVAQALQRLWTSPDLGHVDRARIARAVRQAITYPQLRTRLCDEILSRGPAAAAHPSGQRDLPGRLRPAADHDLDRRQVRLGRVVPHRMTHPSRFDAAFGADLDQLRTNLLAVGPPGSGTTRDLAVPLVEHLALEALANAASVVVVDTGGDDFAFPGWFDVTIDPLDRDSAGLSPYGAARDPRTAARQLASALLPGATTADERRALDASCNALCACLAPYHAAHGSWPGLEELLALLRGERQPVDAVRAALHRSGEGAESIYASLLACRAEQARRRDDPAARLVEGLEHLVAAGLGDLFDRSDAFRMEDVNEPLRVRVVLREAQLPGASRFLARLVVAQFTHLVCDQDTNRGIFKGLLVEDAGRFVDEYVAHAMRRAPSGNAGLLLFSRSLRDFPAHLLPRILGSAGGTAVFGGVGPDDAETLSHCWGRAVRTDRGYATAAAGPGAGDLPDARPDGAHPMPVRWLPGEPCTDLPPGHAVIQLRRSGGRGSPPEVVDLR